MARRRVEDGFGKQQRTGNIRSLSRNFIVKPPRVVHAARTDGKDHCAMFTQFQTNFQPRVLDRIKSRRSPGQGQRAGSPQAWCPRSFHEFCRQWAIKIVSVRHSSGYSCPGRVPTLAEHPPGLSSTRSQRCDCTDALNENAHTRCNTRLAFVPPNPKELESARSIFAGSARLATT